MTPPIAIIGGGPCGLTLARLLECKGIDYVVYERDESETSNTTGGALDLHPETGQNALWKAGLFDEFKRYARYEDTLFKISDIHGTEHLKVGEGRDAPEIDRLELRKILLASIPKDKIKWGHTLASAKLNADGKPVLQFTNGGVVSGFRLAVGTDGAWSKLRSMIEATRRLLLSKEHFGDWAEQYRELINHATNFRSWPLYSLPGEDMAWKSVPGLTLAGDAAHVAFPGGEGVNLAMTDSLELVNKIAEYGIENLDRAVQEFEAAMLPRGVQSIKKGNMMAGVMFSEDHQAFVQLLRSFMPAEGSAES